MTNTLSLANLIQKFVSLLAVIRCIGVCALSKLNIVAVALILVRNKRCRLRVVGNCSRKFASFGRALCKKYSICIGTRMNASAFRDLWVRVMF